MRTRATTGAPETASRAVPATATPSPASASAFTGVRFHARTSIPALRSRRAIALPQIPVPMIVTTGRI
jgi:hypothetical protein